MLEVAISGEVVNDGDFPVENGVEFWMFGTYLSSLRTPIGSLIPFLGHQKLCTRPGISHCHIHPTFLLRSEGEKNRKSEEY